MRILLMIAFLVAPWVSADWLTQRQPETPEKTRERLRILEGRPFGKDLSGPIRFTPDGSRLVLSRTTDVELRDASDLGSPTLLRGLAGTQAGFWNPIDTMDFLPAEDLLVTGRRGGEIEFWNLSGEAPPQLLDTMEGRCPAEPNPPVSRIEVSRDGRLLAAAVGDALQISYRRPLQTPEDLRVLVASHSTLGVPCQADYAGVAISPDSHTVVGASHARDLRGLVVWRTGRAEHQLLPNDRGYLRCWFLPDGERVLAANLGQIDLWDLAGSRRIYRSPFPRPVKGKGTRYALSHDGRHLLTSANRYLSVIDVESGELVRSFEAHERFVVWIDISRDGLRALSSASDGTVAIWDFEAMARRDP